MATAKAKTDIRKKKMLQALAKTRSLVVKACKVAGIGKTAHYDWCQADKEYKEAVDLILEEQVENVEDTLLTLISEKNTAAVIFYLKNKSKDYKPKVELSGSVEVVGINIIPPNE